MHSYISYVGITTKEGVLILVVMEDALVLYMAFTTKEGTHIVLILVVMEDALVLTAKLWHVE